MSSSKNSVKSLINSLGTLVWQHFVLQIVRGSGLGEEKEGGILFISKGGFRRRELPSYVE